MEAIYVISTDKYVKRNIYKVCRHIKSNADYKIYYCKYVRHAEKIETILQNELSKFQTVTKSGNISRWIKFDLEKLSWIIDYITHDYQHKIELNKLARQVRYYGLTNFDKMFGWEYGKFVRIADADVK